MQFNNIVICVNMSIKRLKLAIQFINNEVCGYN